MSRTLALFFLYFTESVSVSVYVSLLMLSLSQWIGTVLFVLYAIDLCVILLFCWSSFHLAKLMVGVTDKVRKRLIDVFQAGRPG